MPFEDLPSRLEDILDAIGDIQEFVKGRSFDDYSGDTMLRLAIERCVEIILEASRHIPPDMKAQHPQVPGKMSPISETSCATDIRRSILTSCGRLRPDT
jgi:uncharacterized protein with HEPN domain